jgi:Family of unknown function (DUF6657)
MAEIKSTMEKVLERAARMAADAGDQANTEDLDRLGMRMAAEFLSGTEKNLSKSLLKQPAEKQMSIRAGMARTLLRNIVLPRDKELIETGNQALQGLMDLGQSSKELSTICSEIKQLLGQYNQHKEQLKQQLEQAVRAQLEQKMGNQRGKHSGQVAMNPAMHPQYQEEWARMLSDLNNQYNQALDQRKNMIQQRLAA